jgi:hypothetical protein
MHALGFKGTAILLSTLLLTSHSASAATASGSGALALAALVGAHAPGLIRHDRRTLEQLLEGHASVPFPANRKISVEAGAIDCTAGNVDITAHACKLTFGAETVHIGGRKAHEFYATMAEVGYRPRVRLARFMRRCRTWCAPSVRMRLRRKRGAEPTARSIR